MSDNQTAPEGQGILMRISNALTQPMERGFEKLGQFIGTRPALTIFISLLIAIAGGSGFMEFEKESRGDRLWVPQDSTSLDHRSFIEKHYEAQSRFTVLTAIPKGSTNVLEPRYIKAALALHKEVFALNATVTGKFADLFPNTYNMDNLCPKIGGVCQMTTVLDFFQYDESLINSLTTTQEVLDILNNPANHFTAFGSPLPPSKIFGTVTTDTSGNIVSAAALKHTYFITKTRVFNSDTGNEEDPPREALEIKFNGVILGSDPDLSRTGYSEHALKEEFAKAINGDLLLIALSYMLIFAYVSISLGRVTSVHSKVALAFSGIIGVGLAVIFSIGVASYLGFFYGPVHSVLPFLILGVGVDDMFILVNALQDTYLAYPLKAQPDGSVVSPISMSTRMGKTLRHAGVSITITSITDLGAFLIGATSVLPALSSFCVYAGIAIFADFLFQCTFFAAFMSYDARRTELNRHDVFCCIVADRPRERIATQINADEGMCQMQPGHLRRFMKLGLAPFIGSVAGKILVFLFTSLLFGASIYGVLNLEQDFKLQYFVLDSSFLKTFFDYEDKYYQTGLVIDIYTREIDGGYHANQDKFEALYDMLDSNPLMDPGTTSWYKDYLGEYVPANSIAVDGNGHVSDETTFYSSVLDFRNLPTSRWSRDIKFVDDGDSASGIYSARMKGTITQYAVDNSRRQPDTMLKLRDQVKSVVSGAFPYSENFVFWEQFVVIERELMQNILLSLLAVFVVTLLLIAHPLTAFLVFICIALTILNLLGLMYFWGTDISTVSVINLVLAIGLAVDYSAHIGHTFMMRTGTRNERAKKALADIGASVLNGAISTFLAVLLLGQSESFVFRVFFKQFLGITLFGVYNGMVVLPVLLSLFGPAAYASAAEMERAGHGASKGDMVEIQPMSGKPSSSSTNLV